MIKKTSRNLINIALNLHSYEDNLSFILEFIKKMYLLLLFKVQNPRHLYITSPVLALGAQHRTLSSKHEAKFFLNSNPGYTSNIGFYC